MPSDPYRDMRLEKLEKLKALGVDVEKFALKATAKILGQA